MDKAASNITCRTATAADLTSVQQFLEAIQCHAYSPAWIMHHTNNLLLVQNDHATITGLMVIWQSPGSYITAVIDQILLAPTDQIEEIAGILLEMANLYAQQKCLRTILVSKAALSGLPASFWEASGFAASNRTELPYAKKVLPKHICLDGKKMRPNMNTLGGQVSEETIFEYQQEGDFVWGTYHGGDVKRGVLVGKMTASRDINFFYMQLDKHGEFHQGTSKSSTEYLNDGRLVLFEDWVWTGNRKGEGTAIIEEIKE